MRAATIEAFPAFTAALEGYVHSMYLDILGLVTTGAGNLIDRPEDACQLPWKHSDGRPASIQEIAEAWRELKARKDLAKMHWKYAAALNDLRLSDADIDALVRSKLLSNEAYIRGHAYPDWDNFSADAQLGCMSMAWAVGPGFPAKFGNFTNRVLEGDWHGAAACCTIREDGNPGIVPRNKANRVCFENAAVVASGELDPELLNYPALVLPPVIITSGGSDGTS